MLIEIEDFLYKESIVDIRIITKKGGSKYNQEIVNKSVDKLVESLTDAVSSGFIDRLLTVLMRTDGVDPEVE